jgi:hypothetical protein
VIVEGVPAMPGGHPRRPVTIWLPDGPDFRDYTVRTDTVEDRF